MSILNNSLLLGADAGGGAGYQISRSLRFNSSDSAYLSRTPASAGNRKTWTLSFWVKRGASTGSDTGLFSTYSGSNPATTGYFNSNDGITFYNYSGSYQFQLITSQVFRDYSAWYHVVFAVDTTQATSSNRVKIYVNGSQITTFSTETYPSQNVDTDWNSTTEHQIGNHASYFNGYLADVHFIDGQALTPSSFAETNATTGQWVPKAYTGSYGTNGFRLDFSDNSAATATTLGKDRAGSNNWTPNNLAVGGAQPALYSSPNLYTNAADVIANGTPLSSGSTFSNVYVYLVTNGGGDVGSKVFTADGSGTIGTNWTWLHRIGASWTSSGGYNNSEWDLFTWGSQTVATNYIMNNSAPLHMLVSSAGSPQQVSGTIATFNSTPNSGAGNDSLVDTPTSYGTDTGAGGEVRGNYCTLNSLSKGASLTLSNGNLDVSDTGATSPPVGSTFVVSSGKWYYEMRVSDYAYAGLSTPAAIGTSVSFLGAATGQIMWNVSAVSSSYIDGVAYNYTTATAAVTGDIIGIALNFDTGVLTFYKNGVSQGAFGTNILSGRTWTPAFDLNAGTSASFNFGQRPFAYTAPSGFKALCDTNLPAPVVAKPSTVMDVKLYTGNGSTQTISGLGFSPDLVWLKSRGVGRNHRLTDTVRGATKVLQSDVVNAEITEPNGLTAFNSNGFTVGSTYSISSEAWVAWCWDAGSSTVTNTQGSITSQVRANASAGFSIITYTSTGSAGTVGHGLGVAPAMFIVKNRSVSSDWDVYHSGLPSPATNRIVLQSTAAAVGAGGTSAWNSTNPTSTVISLGAGTSLNNNGSSHVLYAFSPVAGYSSFGSWTNNNSTDGVFVYTGMRPRFIILKNTDNVEQWFIFDSARRTYNVQYPDPTELRPNSSAAEGSYSLSVTIDFLSNGFKIRGTTSSEISFGTRSYIYAAFAENPFQFARAR